MYLAIFAVDVYHTWVLILHMCSWLRSWTTHLINALLLSDFCGHVPDLQLFFCSPNSILPGLTHCTAPRFLSYICIQSVGTLYKRLYLFEPLWKLRLPLDGSKCHLFHLLTIHTLEALPHGMVQQITAAMLERFQNLNKTSQPNHSYQSM